MTLHDPVKHPVILFDGLCNLCNGLVQYVIKNDRKERFMFCSLQSRAGQRLLADFHLPQHDLNSFVLINHHTIYTKSSAALHVFKNLDGWRRLLFAFVVVPPPIRNVVYDWVAKNRYKWFGKRDACMVPAPDLRKRFLDEDTTEQTKN